MAQIKNEMELSMLKTLIEVNEERIANGDGAVDMEVLIELSILLTRAASMGEDATKMKHFNKGFKTGIVTGLIATVVGSALGAIIINKLIG